MPQAEAGVKREKVCQLCQSIFECCTEKCWCSELPLIMPITKGEDCLCPECLKAAIAGKTEVK